MSGASDERPIGIFDSGVGGLTVLRALMAALPEEHYVYLGDTARVPYGTKSPEVVTRYSLKNAELLRERNIKLLVVACNTASATALPALRARLDVPVVGVIEPGAAAALAVSKLRRIGVIGTPATIASGAYQRCLTARDASVQVIHQTCPLFVPLAEEGWVEGEVPRLVVEKYLAPLAQQKVDVLVLGCTHYPLLRPMIQATMGVAVTLVDSGQAVVNEVAKVAERGEFARRSSGGPGTRTYLVTDVPDRFVSVAQLFLGGALADVQQVDLSF